MASIYTDPKTGRHYVNYTDPSGKRIRKSVKTTDIKAAEMALRKIEADLDKARALGLSSIGRLRPVTFWEFVEQTYMPAKAPPTRRESTHYRDTIHYANVKPYFGEMKLPAITAAEIEKYLTKRKTSKTRNGTVPSASTRNKERGFLSAVLDMAERHDLIDKNPVQVVEPAEENNKSGEALTPAQFKDILARCHDWLRPIVQLGAETGMRRGELLGLRWDQIDREDGEAVEGGWISLLAEETKGNSDRQVLITPAVKALLDAQKPISGPRGFIPEVFVDLDTLRPYQGNLVGQSFKRAARRAGVRATFHWLRHTAVSRLAAAGVPDRVIMKLIGHSTPDLVSLYTHVSKDDIKREIGRISVRKASESASVKEAATANR